MHCGESADDIREAIAREIEGWMGEIAVVHGDLSDELQDDTYQDLRCAVEGCSSYDTVGAATENGLGRAARRFAKAFELKAGDVVTVTGAWADKDGSGCVTAVANALNAIGLKATVSANAACSD